MAATVGDFLVDRLYSWGVRRIYGYPGDGINGVFGALNRAHGKIEFIQVRHEEMAAFMAAAHAKFTGELGVCIATSGPGASHLDHRPLRRTHGSHARARHCRSASPRGAWRALSAGTRSRIHVQGRGRRVRRNRRAFLRRSATSSIAPCAWRWPSARSRPSSCQTTCRISSTRRPAASTARCIQASGYRAPRIVPYRRRLATSGGCPQRRQEGRDPRRRGCAACDR